MSSREKAARNAVLKRAGRIYCRLGGLFTHIFDVVNTGVRWDIARDTEAHQNHPTVLVAPPVTDEEVNLVTPST